MIELILALTLSYQQNVFSCTVTEPDKTISCPIGRNPENRAVILHIDNWHEEMVDEWRWNVEYVTQGDLGRSISYNAPLKKEPLFRGQKVKITLDEYGRVIPLARCDVRVWRKVHEFTDMGQPAPNSARRQPDDCVETVRY